MPTENPMKENLRTPGFFVRGQTVMAQMPSGTPPAMV